MHETDRSALRLSERIRLLNASSRYLLAALITTAAVIIRLALQPVLHTEGPFATFYIANIISAVYLGPGPTLAAMAAGGIATAYFFIPPLSSFAVADYAWGFLYALTSLTAMFFIEREYRAQEAARKATRSAEDSYQALILETVAKDAARRSEDRHRRWAEVTLSSIGDAVVSTDDQGCVNFINRVAESLTGWTHEEALGKPISDVFQIFNHTTGEPAEMPVAKVLSSGAVQGLANDTVLVSKSGKRTPIDDSAAPIRDAGGALIGVVLVFRDITERKKRDDALRRSNEDLKRFAFIASHDLQEPLRTIAGFVGLLKNRYQDRLDLDGVRYIDFALDATRRMHTLIRDLLQYSRVGTQALKLAPVDLNRVVDEVVGNVRVLMNETAAVFHRDELPIVLVDAVKIGQVLQNLISNSLKFRDSAAPEIRISSELREGNWVFAVHDNGIGFESQYAERIFGMFERLHNVGAYPGSGIGLALCKRIVEEHGGHIWAVSEKGTGSSFYFTLPANNGEELVRRAGAQ